jgi:predicted alpha/beta-hydrolase family hydrolase
MSPSASPSGLLLIPGAGAGRDQPALVAIDAAVTRLGLVVERIDFPYRLAGRRRPDPPRVLMETVCSAAEALAARTAERGGVILGGRSMGGRICSMVVAAGMPAAGLVLVSYPLHPPGQPAKRRTEHFPFLHVPCLFVSGRRDSFASVSELESATASIDGPVTHVWVEGDHGLKGRDAEVASIVAEWVNDVVGQP